MNVRLELLSLTTMVIPEGRLDYGAAEGFQAQVQQLLAGATTKPHRMIVDCAGLDYVSSAGLRVFLLAARASERAGHELPSRTALVTASTIGGYALP